MNSQNNIAESGLSANAYRRNVLQLLLIMTFICGVIFSALNWSIDQTLALLELVLAGYSLLLVPFSKHIKNQFKLSLLYLIPLYSLFLYALTLPREAETAFVWILVIPVLSHLLLGRWVGLWVSVGFMSLAFIIYIFHTLSEKEILDTLEVSNLALAASAVLIFSHVYEVSRVDAHRKLLHLATTDSLTSLANRARFLDVFERERNHAARNKSDLSLLLLDLDHFKQVNDLHGHDVGDEVLKYVSALISQRLRKTDLACRMGGEEFAVLLPGASLERAIMVAEDIRQNISDLPYTKGEKVVPLSVSIGVSEYGFDGRDLEALYAIADGHLYKAKAGGRNQVRNRVNMRNCELDLALAD
jgi:diguanylate cyclase (GGDEF)-like protein